jgi:hypothetical protein
MIFAFIFTIFAAVFIIFMLNVAVKHDSHEHEKLVESENDHNKNLNYIKEKLDIHQDDGYVIIIESIAKILRKMEDNERTSQGDQ